MDGSSGSCESLRPPPPRDGPTEPFCALALHDGSSDLECREGLCSCTGGSPPCGCVCGDGLCGPAEDCSTCPADCGSCPPTNTTEHTSACQTSTTPLTRIVSV